MQIPNIDKRNWKKLLRELDIAKFPSLPAPLIALREKLLRKEELTYTDGALGYARFSNYLEQYSKEINSLYIQTINWDKFKDRPPLDHQKPGVEFLLKNNRCILGDDMGLGKSATAIMAVLLMDPKMKVLLVTLKSLKYNFAKEISYFSNDYVVIDKKFETAKFTIIHYDAIKKYNNELLAAHYDIVILDEAHKIRNHKTQRSKFITGIINTHKPVKLWLMTGTPVDNRPVDYYQLLKIIKHPIAKNWITFVTRYCEGQQNAYGQWEVNGASNLKELYNMTQDVFLRRLKTDAGHNLPTKTRRPIFIELKNRKGYDNVIEAYKTKKLADVEDYIKENPFFEGVEVQAMTELVLYRLFCALEKVKDGTLIELAENMLEENSTNKIIIFTNFRGVVDAVSEHFGKRCLFIDGRILDPKKRLAIVDQFNEDPTIPILCCNMKAAGIGLNITGANKEIVNDMDWVPSTMLQAEDRAWRIGQKRDVEVIYPIYDKTAEVALYSVVEEKMRIISTVVEGKEEEYFKDSTKIDIPAKKVDNKQSIIDAIIAQMRM